MLFKKPGRSIRLIRESKHLSREYVAAQLGISSRALGNIENDKCSVTLERINELATILGVSVYDLVPREKQVKNKEIYKVY
jgi:transcriptional regulator with XRE-family HTH domain